MNMKIELFLRELLIIHVIKKEKAKKIMDKKRKNANRSYDTLPWKLVTGRFP